jgi:hypothetical protein
MAYSEGRKGRHTSTGEPLTGYTGGHGKGATQPIAQEQRKWIAILRKQVGDAYEEDIGKEWRWS